MTRPSTRLTLAEVVTLAQVTYAVAYHRVAIARSVPSAEQDAAGVWTIARQDLHLIRRREPKHPDGRRAFNLKVSPERAQAWKRASGRRSVQAWLTALADVASGYHE